MSKAKSTRTARPSGTTRITQDMIENGVRAFRAKMTREDYHENSKRRAGDVANDGKVVRAIYKAMEVARISANRDASSMLEARLGTSRGHYKEAEVEAAVSETLSAYSRYLVNMDEYGISDYDQRLFVKRVGRHLRGESEIDPADLWIVA